MGKAIEYERYRRNLLVEGFSDEQQQQLSASRVTVVGAGGLGSAVLNYLVAAGVGFIRIIENDSVSLSNLQRQILYTTDDLGKDKATTAAVRLARINPLCRIETTTERLDPRNAEALLSGSQIIVDCTDNYTTRYVIDDYCAAQRIPMVYGSAEQIGGQVSVFNTGRADRYRDLYPTASAPKDEVGVLPPMVGIVGSFQALETIKWITGMGTGLDGRLLSIDGRTLQITLFEI